MMLNTMVVDDEPLARSRVIELLAEDPEINVIGQARNGKEANRLITAKKPDLIFLDIQMPDYDGFTVLSKINAEARPVVIFVTAFDQFAINAFELNAIDYLLKPFDNHRFFKSLNNAKNQIKLKRFSKLSQGLLDLVESYKWEQLDHPQTIPIKNQGLIEEIPIDQIICIEAHGNYVKLYLPKKWYLYRNTISQLTKKLEKFEFLRIHRSLLVNANFIKKITYTHNNEYRIQLINDTEYHSSRSYKTAIDAFVLTHSNLR